MKNEVIVSNQHKVIEDTSHRYSKNPFFDYLEIKSTDKLLFAKTDAIVTNQKTGELMGHQVVARYKKVDAESFVKIFAHHLTSIFSLSRTGYRMLVIVIAVIQNQAINSDTFYMSFHDASEEAVRKQEKMSRDTFKKGVAELITNGIIARAVNVNQYYINPSIIYNGNRTKITFVEQYDVMPKEEYAQQSLLEDLGL